MKLLNKNFEPRDYLRLLIRRKWYFLIPFMLVLGAGIFQIITELPEYESFCIIEIKTSRLPARLQRVVPGVTDYNTYVSLKKQILNSDNLVKLINRLKLNEKADVYQAALEMQKKIPEKNIDEIIQYILVKNLQKNIKVRIYGNNILEIRITATSPESAYNKVKTLMDIFMEDYLKRESASVKIIKDFNYQQLDIFKKELEQAEQKLNKYKKELIIDQNDKYETLSEEALNRINEAVVAMDIYIKVKRDYLDYLRGQLKNKDQNIIKGFPETPVIKNYFSEIEIKIGQMADLMRSYSWKSPEIIKVNKNINDLRNSIKNEIENYYKNYFKDIDVETLGSISNYAISLVDIEIVRTKKQFLNQVIESSKISTSMNQANELTITNLQEKVDVNRDIYNLFLEQIHGTQIEESIQRANESSRFNILEPPFESLEPTSAGYKLKLVLIIFFASLSGIGVVYLREFFNKSIDTVDDAEELFGIPVLGILPFLDNEPLIQSARRKLNVIKKEA
jgi:succinoglycan biosynthesis transport protein ExoP